MTNRRVIFLPVEYGHLKEWSLHALSPEVLGCGSNPIELSEHHVLDLTDVNVRHGFAATLEVATSACPMPG